MNDLADQLYSAVSDENIIKVKELVLKMDNVNSKNSTGESALTLFRFEKDLKILKFLLDNNIDVQALSFSEWQHITLKAIFNGMDDLFFTLLERVSSELINSKSGEGWTTLMYAVYYGRNEITEFLIERGNDVNASNKNDYSVLMEAVYKKNNHAVKLLMQNGADTSFVNSDGQTVFHLCVNSVRIDCLILEALLSAKDYINIKDKKGRSALHYACCGFLEVDIAGNKERSDYNSHINAIEILIKNGADIGLKDNDGKIPYNIAEETGFAEALNLLTDNCKISGERLSFDLYIKLGNRKKIPEKLLKEFKYIIDKTKNDFYDIYILILAGLLQILDDEKPEFKCQSLTGPDMFGGGDVNWTLQSSISDISRKEKKNIDDNMHSVIVEIDKVECNGSLIWDGKYDSWGTELTLLNISEDKELKAISFAEELFEIKTFFRKNIRYAINN